MTRELVVTAAVIAIAGTAMILAETLAPLRRTVESKLRHVTRNLSIGGVSLAVTTLLHAPLLQPVAAWIQREHIGLLQWVTLPPWVETVIAIVLLDYTLYWWHVATHRVPFLWRFHLVHHADRDLDASTALRFHFGELALSIPVRALQMMAIGVEPHALWLWQTILFASILFHHANLRLPRRFENVLVRVVVTPRMHGIHHSDRRDETDSNWSSLLSIWDFLHRTARLDVPQERVVIGVPAYEDPHNVTIGKMLLLPFRRRVIHWMALVLLAALPLAAEPLTFKVLGIDCDECGPPLTKALTKVQGVKSAKVDADAGTATVDVPSGFDREKLRAAVSNIGFAAVLAGEKPRDLEKLPADVVKTLDIVSYTNGKRVDFAKIAAPGKITVVDFYADWCGPCHVLETRLQHLMKGNRDLALRRVDVGKWDNAAAKQITELRAKELPYVRVYDARGKFVAAVAGGMWDEVLTAIEKAER